MRKVFEIGGYAAAVVLVAFGVASIVMGVNGHNTVNSTLGHEQITGTPDMTPSGIAAEITAGTSAQAALIARMKTAGIIVKPSPITKPTCSVAGEPVDSGASARCFADYMRVHTFGATSGLTYSQMGQYQALPSAPLKATDGLGGTSDSQYAVLDAKTQLPVTNGRRNLWVTYTSLTTALNTSYMASQLSLFGIVVGIALLLSGLGFAILTVFGALGHRSAARAVTKPVAPAVAPAPLPTA
jgi:hypothetical protein